MVFEPVPRQRRLHEVVADQIEAMIRSGDLVEGSELPAERDLRDRFEVGRPAIREALLMLQQKGLILMSNGERARVTRPDAGRLINALSGAAHVYLAEDEGVRQFQTSRRIFEGGVVHEVAAIATDVDIARIATALAANRASINDAAEFGRTDVAFHLAIVHSLRNPVLSGVHEALSGWLTEQRRTSLAVKGAAASALAFHERIFAAIAAHDAGEALAVMQAHLDAVSAYYWS